MGSKPTLPPVTETVIAAWSPATWMGRYQVRVDFWVAERDEPDFIRRLMEVVDQEFSRGRT